MEEESKRESESIISDAKTEMWGVIPLATRRRILKSKDKENTFVEFFTKTKCESLFPGNKYATTKNSISQLVRDIIDGVRNSEGQRVVSSKIFYSGGKALEAYIPRKGDSIKKIGPNQYSLTTREEKQMKLSDKARENILRAKQIRKNEELKEYDDQDRVRKSDIRDKRKNKFLIEENTNFEFMFNNSKDIEKKREDRKNKSVHPHARRFAEKKKQKEERAEIRNKLVSLKESKVPPQSLDVFSFNSEFFKQVFDGGLKYYDVPENRLICSFVVYFVSLLKNRDLVSFTLTHIQFMNVCYGIRKEQLYMASQLPEEKVDTLPINSLLQEKYEEAFMLCKRLFRDINRHFGRMPDVTLEVPPQSFFSEAERVLRFCRDNTNKVFHSTLVQQLKNVLISLISMQLFNKDLAYKFKRLVGSTERMSILEAVQSMVDSFISLLSIGDKVSKSDSVVEVLLSGDPVSKCVTQIQELMRYEDSLYTGLPVEGKMCKKQYVIQGSALVSTSKLLLDDMNPLSAKVCNLRDYHDKINISVGRVKSELLCQSRAMPYGIVLHGGPGVGKGRIMPLILSLWSKIKGRDYCDSHVFHRVMSSKYWEGYDPISTPYVHYSEVGNTARELARAKGDVAVDELTSLIDTVPMSLDAAFDMKGKLYARPELVILDTNSPDLNLDVLVKNKAAFERRFLYIEPIVLPQFCEMGSTALNVEASLASSTDINDRWTFNVTVRRPESVHSSREDFLLRQGEKSNIYTLMTLLESYFTKHIELQDQVIEKTGQYQDPARYIIRKESDVVPSQDWKIRDYPFRDRFNDLCKWGHRFSNCFQTLFSSGIMFLMIFILDTRYRNWLLHSFSYVRMFVVAIFLYICWNGNLIGLIFGLVGGLLFSEFFRVLCAHIFHKSGAALKRSMLDSLKEIGYLFGLVEDYNSVFSKYTYVKRNWLLLTGGTVFFAYAVMKLLAYMWTEKAIPPEDESSCEMSSIEDFTATGISRARVAIKNQHKIWNTVDFVSSGGVHTGSLSELEERIRRNVRTCYIHKSFFNVGYTQLLGLKGDFCLINTHAIPSFPLRLFLTKSAVNAPDTLQGNVFVTIEKDQSCDLGNDLTLLRISGQRFSNVLPHLMTTIPVQRQYVGRFNGEDVVAMLWKDGRTLDLKDGPLLIPNMWEYNSITHKSGSCGTPLLLQVGSRPVLAGFHVGGFEGKRSAFSRSLLLEEIEEGISQLLASSSLLEIHSEGVFPCQSMEMPISKSLVRYEDLRSLHYLGKIPGPVLSNAKSKLKKTPYSDEVLHLFESVFDRYDWKRYGPPMMQACRIDKQYISPFNIASRVMAIPKTCLDEKLMSKVLRVFKERVWSKLDEENFRLSPLNVETAVNGSEIDPYLRSMNLSTSAGFGKTGLKRDYFIRENEKWLPCKDLEKDLVSTVGSYLRGDCYNPVNVAKLKDEARSVEKIRQGKTRVFFVAPLDNVILSRMYLYPFYTLMVEYNDLFGTAVGIDAQRHFDTLYTRMISFSPLIMAGDYANFDIRIPFGIKHCAATFVFDTLQRYGYNDSALKVVRGLLSDSLFPLVDLLNDLFIVTSQQPSGKYATAEDNSLCNVLMLMYFFYSIPELESRNFFDFVHPVTYGDDLLASVRDDISESFNNITYQKFCKEIYGIDYTDPEKSDTMRDFCSLDECTFLKRSFSPHSTTSKIVGKLELDSILKSLMWYIPSNMISPDEQLGSTIVSALYELFLAVDKKQFVELRKNLISFFVDQFGEVNLDQFPTYEDLSEHFSLGDPSL